MKRDWDQRATENARWYINTLSREQTEEEFDLSGKREFEGQIIADLGILTDRRNPRDLRFLEIGCGVGRITKYLAGVFGQVCATDVSGEMIRRASSRLSTETNVTFLETDGKSFSEFSGESFDVIFAAYVFQHVPSPAIIESNIREAYRLLKPRGVFKFVTNAVDNEEFGRMRKDTWTGASFPESSIRRLAIELDAQLPGVYGDGTQYCWSFIRKPSADQIETSAPIIERVGRAENPAESDLSPRTGNMAIALTVRGFDYNTADVNNTFVGFRDKRLIPYYAGPTSIDSQRIIDGEIVPLERERMQVSVMIPASEPAGPADLYVEVRGRVSNTFSLILPELHGASPQIHVVLDAADNAAALRRDRDARLKVVFSHAGGALEPGKLEFRINSELAPCVGTSYLAANGLWEAVVQLPELLDNNAVMQVEVDDLVSPQFPIAFFKDE